MPSDTGLFLPWELSPTVVLTLGLAALLYARGMARTPSAAPLRRRAGVVAALALVYAALQTGWDYYASHMFSVLQLQHFALHDLAPALLMGSAPGAALAQGLPAPARGWLQRRAGALRIPLRLLLDPRVAALLYVASQIVWLWPPVAFAAMVSNRLYKLMSWSSVLGALPFWHLVLDPKDYPQGRLRLRGRFALLYIGMTPMMLASACLAFSASDWYPVYAVCGRFAPVSAVADQELAGLAMWVPGGLLAGWVFIAILGRRLERSGRAAARRRPASGQEPPGRPGASLDDAHAGSGEYVEGRGQYGFNRACAGGTLGGHRSPPQGRAGPGDE